ncbi:uncharacterized protein LY79DRAFT_344110 [Colletotrichum navitas]|uniref:Protein ECM13 n=1 Tax=Colletotrichum navitas TaxID=681940 RepID=A0AAD8PRN2_9PEZI|nr:uncharacterized protein LY79DRAFT_344110 [Colletotrichum navitas]KAK1579499.1 hypothetical protein LY79DRAFT_344110 [Colletotrichum navitas]
MSTTTTATAAFPPHTQQQFRSSSSPLRLAVQKKKMSITQTYYLAHKARAKLSSEAARADHDLRLLVGHANLLDSLMLDLADAEREQERWFNQSVRGATKTEERHVQWADSVVEDPEDDWHADDASDSDDSSSDSDDDYDEHDIEMANTVSLRRMPSASAVPTSLKITTKEVSEDYDMEDDLEEDYAQLELVRTPSHSSSSSPPELEHDSDISDDESMPPSPPNAVLTFTEKDAKEEISQQQQQQTDDGSFYSEGYYLPPRNPARLVSAISVY